MLSHEKIKIFVSSTIKECAQERQTARDAIRSINHDPILFEDFGASHHPPRSMYQRGIEESAMFIAIYRDSYGYIAEGVIISGLEDEYRIASARGMPRLIYVSAEAQKRDSHLTGLISEIKQSGGVTVCLYSNPTDLYDLIRDNLTAAISETFLASDPQEFQALPTPSTTLDSLVLNPLHRLRRPGIEKLILDLVSRNSRLVIFGPLGCGKTILLLLLASDNQWIYLNAHGRSGKEVLGKATNSLRSAMGQLPIGFMTFQAAERAFTETWMATKSVTLVVDGLEDLKTFMCSMEKVGEVSPTRHLILSTRNQIAVPAAASFAIPKLERDEVEAAVSAIRGEAPSIPELNELLNRSDGNYLYLRYYASGPPGQFENDLKDYELREWQALPPLSREALTYIVLADVPLSLSTLHKLLGDKKLSIEGVVEILSKGSHLLRVTETHYEIFHEHFRDTIYELIKSNSPQHRFYARRLGMYLHKLGDSLSAFFVLDQAKDRNALVTLDEASFQAAYCGEVVRGIQISERRLALARERADQEGIIISLLSLAELKQQSGEVAGSLDALSQAQVEAQRANNADWLLFVRERQISMQSWSTGSTRSIQELSKLCDDYTDNNDEFSAARVRLNLSAAYIHGCNYTKAAEEARTALESFKKLGDDYGITIAKNNLLSALSSLPEHTQEAESLLNELSKKVDLEAVPRQRAFICNVYSKRHRERGNYDLAIGFSKEAIAIGQSLGDAHLVALNQINLGNAYRDKGELDLAFIEYTEASKGANTAKIVQLEASANEATAQIHNLRNEPRKALTHATYAIALARDTSDRRTLARAYRERAEANESLNKRHDAIEDYLEGSRALSDQPDYGNLKLDLIEEGLWLIAEEDLRMLSVGFLSLLAPDGAASNKILPPQDILYNKLPTLLKDLPYHRVIDISGLLFRLILGKMPPLYAKRIIKKLIERLKPRATTEGKSKNLVLALATLVTSAPSQSLSAKDVVEIAESVSAIVDGLYFKPHPDGSLHWTLMLEFNTPVLCTIEQIDDRVDIALSSMVLALLLKGLEREIQTELLLVDTPPRSEVSMKILNVDELTTFIDRAHLTGAGLELPMKQVCSVTRSTDPISDNQPPLLIICRDDLIEGWQPGYRKGGALQVMLGLVLPELVYFLLNGQVDFEALKPKIISVVRKTVS